MAKKDKSNNVGVIYRRQLENIGLYLGFSEAKKISNRLLIDAIASRRDLPVGLTAKGDAEAIVAWFHKHENPAIKSPRCERRVRQKKPPTPQRVAFATREEFYKSWEWRTVRMEVLKFHGARCNCCGAGRGHTTTSGEPVRICVDHIQPLSQRWDLRLDKSNLQVLCDECNQGKGAWDQTDWRPEVTA